MKDSRKRAKIVRRRKVANLAAYSRQHTVRNNIIPESEYKWNIIPFNTYLDKMPRFGYVKVGGTVYRIDSKGKVVYKNDAYKHEKHPQYKPMMKKGRIVWFTKEDHDEIPIPVWERRVKRVKSEYPDPQIYQKKLWKNLGKAAKMEAYTQDKLKKWEKKHPKPCPNDDLFKDEFIPQWEHEKEEALIRIRDFVVSMFDKLPLTGRFKISETGTAQYQEEKIAELKDINGDGHRVNELDKNSKLLKKAQETVNKVHAKRTNLVAGNLKDHKRNKGRVILPQAA